MKKLIYVMCCFLASHFAQGQVKNNFKVNLLSPIVLTGSVFYERALGESISLQAGIFYTSVPYFNFNVRGFGFTPEFRFYLSEGKQAPAGFYLAPFLRYQDFKLKERVTFSSATLTSIGGGLCIGNQWVIKNLITIDIFGGPSYSKKNIKIDTLVQDENYDDIPFLGGFGLRFGVTLGIAF